MRLEPRTRLGSLEIVAHAGSGGMGSVYRARDLKLNRDVAIKVLPEAFACDPDRVARFTREAQALAALNHPSIAHVYGLEDLPPNCALIMEFVQGQTLETRLAGGRALPLADAVSFARQIAAGLEAAHEKGIIHRDLKPANIMVSPDDQLKILDFGLAKAIEVAAAGVADAMNSPTMLSPVMTTQGVILGTGAYMSPEQARGRPVDKRSDIWAFGVVLWEMITGLRPFARETVTDTLAALVSAEPPWAELPADLPDGLRRLIARCLVKDPQQRLRDIGDARIALEDPATVMPRAPAMAQSGPSGGRRGRWSGTAFPLAAGAALLIAALTIVALLRPRAAASALMTSDIDAPAGSRLRLSERPALEISPDGNLIAFAAVTDDALQIFVRRRDDSAARPLPVTVNTVRQGGDLAFSPDSRFVAVTDGSAVTKVPLDGGPLVRLVPVFSGTRGIAWAGRTIVYSPAPRTGLYAVDQDGGEPRELTKVAPEKGERSHRWPVALPGGKAILFTVGALGSPDSYNDADIDALVLATGERRRILQGASFVKYAPGGRLIFARGGSLYAVAFDPDRLAVSGSPVLVAQQVARDPNTGAVHFSIAQDGTLIYAAGSASEGLRRPVWVDRSGATELIDLTPDVYNDPSISPDGRRVALLVGPIGHGDIWIYDFTQTTFTRLTSDGKSATPTWSADGLWLYYVSLDTPTRKTIIYRRAADGSGDAERVTSTELRAYIGSVVPERDLAIGAANKWVGSFNVFSISLQGGQVTALTESRTQAYAVEASPDRKWIAYTSEESGKREVYVQSLAGTKTRTLISTAGGEEAHWSPDGRIVYYRLDDRLMGVAVQTAGGFVASKPVLVLRGMYDLQSETGLSYTIDPRTGRFLMLRLAGNEGSVPRTSFRIVLNWAAHLDQRAGSSEQ
jgi:eukaryotic-like serine/threonine-protein kinase